MKRRKVALVVLGVVIAAIQATGWVYVVNSTLGSEVTKLPKPEVVASSLNDMMLTTEINLQRSQALAEAVKTLSSGLGGSAVDPFMTGGPKAGKKPADARPLAAAPGAGKTAPERGGVALVLDGTVLAQGRPLAMINQELYGIGDRVGAFAVTAIEEGSVALSSPGVGEVVLKLKEREEPQ